MLAIADFDPHVFIVGQRAVDQLTFNQDGRIVGDVLADVLQAVVGDFQGGIERVSSGGGSVIPIALGSPIDWFAQVIPVGGSSARRELLSQAEPPKIAEAVKKFSTVKLSHRLALPGIAMLEK